MEFSESEPSDHPGWVEIVIHMTAKRMLSFRTLLTDATVWVALGMVAVMWVAIVVTLRDERQQAISAAVDESSKLTIALQEQAANMFADLDRTLKLSRARLQLTATSEDLRRLLAEPDLADPRVEFLAIIDLRGYVVASNAKSDAVKLYAGDREHVAFHFTTPDDVAFLGKPVIARATSRLALPMTRKFYDADGKFGGVILASISPNRVSDYYASLLTSEGAEIALIGFDGVYRARGSRSKSSIGGTSQDTALLAAAKQSPVGVLIEPATDKISAMIHAYRVIEPFPVFVSVTVREMDALAEYTAHARTATLFGAIMTAVIVLLAVLIMRNRRQLGRTISVLESNKQMLAEKTQQLSVTLDHMERGLMMVDREGIVRVINRRLVELIDLPPQFLSRKLLYSDVVADLMARRDFGNDLAAGESGLRQAMDFDTSSTVPIKYIRRRKNGRYIEVQSEPMPEGGFVRTFSDITELCRRDEAMNVSARNLHRFTQIASRDLQEPMYDISSQVARLREAFERRDRSHSDRAINHLAESAQKVRAVANDLVDYTQQCVRTLETRSSVIGDIIAQSFGRMRQRYPDQPVEFVSRLPRIEVNCDPDVIRCVFDSLFANAFAFRNGNLPLEIKVYGQFCSQNESYQLHFRDNGSGFMSNDHERIFEPFARLMGQTGHVDMGIDLALAQVGVEKHGWKITGNSVIDMGSTFSILIARCDLIEVDGVRQMGGGDVAQLVSAAA